MKKDHSIQDNLGIINTLAVEPFFNLLCAGEEKKPKFIGAKILDAGDIIQTLSGWTVVGYGKSEIPMFKFLSDTSDFRKKGTETHKGIQVMEQAMNELSARCRPSDAKRALYLLSGPPDEMSMSLMNELGGTLRRLATDANIRSGDYPRTKRALEVTLVLSELTNVTRVMEYFTKAIQYINSHRKRWAEIEYDSAGIGEAFKDIPSLL